MSAHRRTAPSPRWLRIARRALAIALLTCGVVVSISGLAVAYFLSSGSGSGSVTAGALNVAVRSATASVKLVPGGSAGLVLTVDNDSGSTVTITSVSVGTVTGCTTPSVVYTAPSTYPPIPAGTNQQVTLPNALSMGAGSGSDCQGASLTIPVTVAVKQ